MLNGDKAFTKGGNIRASSLVTVCEWVYDAYQQLDPAIIVIEFLNCGISNALNGTEDKYLSRKPNALADSVQENSSTRKHYENNNQLDVDDDLYDDVTNTGGIEERNELFGASNSHGENDFEDFE